MVQWCPANANEKRNTLWATERAKEKHEQTSAGIRYKFENIFIKFAAKWHLRRMQQPNCENRATMNFFSNFSWQCTSLAINWKWCYCVLLCRHNWVCFGFFQSFWIISCWLTEYSSACTQRIPECAYVRALNYANVSYFNIIVIIYLVVCRKALQIKFFEHFFGQFSMSPFARFKFILERWECGMSRKTKPLEYYTSANSLKLSIGLFCLRFCCDSFVAIPKRRRKYCMTKNSSIFENRDPLLHRICVLA